MQHLLQGFLKGHAHHIQEFTGIQVLTALVQTGGGPQINLLAVITHSGVDDTQALAALETMPGLADYMQAWLTAPYEFYFSEDGLMDFVRTGRIVDVDASLTGPLPPEARRELLLRMRTACENNTAVLRIVSAEAFPLDPHITVTAFRGRSVVFCTLSDDPQEGFCREYTLRDAMLANRLADYMSNLKDSSLVCTQRYTLEYIDFCLRLL